MLLKKFAKRFDSLRLHATRILTDTVWEAVFYSADEKKWTEIFVDEFGPPIKKKGDPLPEDERHWISDTGGIWEDQTLFGKIIGNGIAIAKFQPWKDGVHITLKLMVLKKGASHGK